MTNAMHLDQLAVGYDSTLLTANLTIEQGIVAILGPSGSGKSTLLATILGSQPARAGSIRIREHEVTNMPIHQRSVGMVFQDPLLFPHLNVGDNIMYGMRRAGMKHAEAHARALELLDWVSLSGYENRHIHELSGGQAQRVALARALAPKPDVLLLDEPYSALDSDLRARLASEVAELLRTQHVIAVHVTHDEHEARSITDLVYQVTQKELLQIRH